MKYIDDYYMKLATVDLIEGEGTYVIGYPDIHQGSVSLKIYNTNRLLGYLVDDYKGNLFLNIKNISELVGSVDYTCGVLFFNFKDKTIKEIDLFKRK